MEKKYFYKLKKNLINGTIPDNNHLYGDNGIAPYLEDEDLLNIMKINKYLRDITEKHYIFRKRLELIKLDNEYKIKQEKQIISRNQRENFIKNIDNDKLNSLSKEFEILFFSDIENYDNHLTELERVYHEGGSSSFFEVNEFENNLCVYFDDLCIGDYNNYEKEIAKINIAINSDLDKHHLLSQKTYAGMGGITLINYVVYSIFDNYFQPIRKDIHILNKISFELFEYLYCLDISEYIYNIFSHNYKISYDKLTIRLQIKFFKMILLLIKKTEYYENDGNFLNYIKASFLIYSKYEYTFLPIFFDEIANLNVKLLDTILYLENRKLIRYLVNTRFIKDYLINTLHDKFKNLLFNMLRMKEYYSLKILINHEIEKTGTSKLLSVRNEEGLSIKEILLLERGVVNKFLDFVKLKITELGINC